MVNNTGVNGVDNGTKPSDEELSKTLHGFARLQLSLLDRLDELGRIHGYHIKIAKLKQLNIKFGVASIRKPPALPFATALVAPKVLEDITRRHGASTIQKQIARETGQLLPSFCLWLTMSRDTVREIQHSVDPEGAQTRFGGGKKVPKQRGQLHAVGLFEELHWDGHEKLGSKALQMGSVGIPIYGGRDHIGAVIELQVVPNDRCRDTVLHVYLDSVQTTGYMAVQNTFDHGTETGYVKRVIEQLRYLTELQRPSTVCLKSTDNIVAESMWSYWLNYAGRNIQATMLQGKVHGWFAQGDPVHINLFQWIWSKIVQNHLDLFKEYWNSTPRRSQVNKALPTAAPNMVMNNPQKYGMEHCGTNVPLNVVQEMRAWAVKSREECMRWVPDEFDELACQAYHEVGSPVLRYPTGWETFNEMLVVLQAM
ncbi:hypothetical protein GGX14DRAFT_600920 [Mycena pura]|uniref:Uncharacterized protein n=1 Tax=Mycena pura TaxID=153505 RepID=A0AAD6URE4_9AGAR|nr:hypothetical protein GGX14DRAFT_600920 [Mycena pura]